MEHANLLDQLIDVYEPPAVSWWPLAPGWWFLILLTVIALVVAITLALKKYRQNEWRREALKALKSIQLSLQTNHSLKTQSDLLKLIKQSLYSKTRDQSVTTLVSHNLIARLQKEGANEKLMTLATQMQDCLYQGKELIIDNETFEIMRTWIKSL